MKFFFNDDMTDEEKAKAILDGYHITANIHPDFYDVFVDILNGDVEYDDGDFNYTYSVDCDAEKVNWIAELLSGVEVETEYLDVIKEFNSHDYWIYKVISYGYKKCRLVRFEDFTIETIN